MADEMVVVDGVRYQLADAVARGLVKVSVDGADGPTKPAPAKARRTARNKARAPQADKQADPGV